MKILFLAAIAAIAADPVRVSADGKLVDFTESRYSESNAIFWALNSSCVSRNYTIRMLNGREIVLQHNTCTPGRDPGPMLEIGQPVTTIEGKRPRQMGIILPDSKILWLTVFKVTLKPPSQGQTELAEHQSAEGTPKTVAESQAQLTITSEPSGAEIEISGEFIGNTPATLKVKEGSITVTLKKAGYQPWQRSLKVSVGDKRTLQAEMLK